MLRSSNAMEADRGVSLPLDVPGKGAAWVPQPGAKLLTLHSPPFVKRCTPVMGVIGEQKDRTFLLWLLVLAALHDHQI